MFRGLTGNVRCSEAASPTDRLKEARAWRLTSLRAEQRKWTIARPTMHYSRREQVSNLDMNVVGEKIGR